MQYLLGGNVEGVCCCKRKVKTMQESSISFSPIHESSPLYNCLLFWLFCIVCFPFGCLLKRLTIDSEEETEGKNLSVEFHPANYLFTEYKWCHSMCAHNFFLFHIYTGYYCMHFLPNLDNIIRTFGVS